MGRKKRLIGEDGEEQAPPRKIIKTRRRDSHDSSDASSSDHDEELLIHHDIDPQVQDLAYTFGLDDGLTQRVNDILVGKRKRTIAQDVERLHEILKDARSPAAVLNVKIKDMLSGRFVGKAKCAPAVRELARKHRLDKGASTKLEEAMSMREAMGKDITTDLRLLEEHLEASNKPSALVSQKLDTLRKGYNIGHCIYSREPVLGNTGPGVDGVFDKKSKRALGYSDADLDKRFQAIGGGPGNGELMDEATIMKLMRKEKAHHFNKIAEEQKRNDRRKRSRSRSARSTPSPMRKKGSAKSRSRSRRKRKSKSPSRRKRRRSPSRDKGNNQLEEDSSSSSS